MGECLSKANECLCQTKDKVETIVEAVQESDIVNTVQELNERIRGDL
jgi:hypothetical protein